jgi:hypothetical protein
LLNVCLTTTLLDSSTSSLQEQHKTVAGQRIRTLLTRAAHTAAQQRLASRSQPQQRRASPGDWRHVTTRNSGESPQRLASLQLNSGRRPPQQRQAY